jgi:hypothetical protein
VTGRAFRGWSSLSIQQFVSWVAAAVLALTLAGCAPPSVTASPLPAAAGPRPGAVGGPAGRCALLLAQFDEVVGGSPGAWPLMLDQGELADARAARDQAEADCTAGRYGFGLPLIEGALREIGVVPPPADDGRPDPP